jgi:hypothetical protein
MPLTPGTRLGSYEILSSIGAGGMGEVYSARDTRLNREVAIKVLPAAFAGDPERRARFEREAQAVATLSHPNVVAIHDTGVHDGQAFVVMELLAGQSLRERLNAGPVPARKAIDFGVQIARGLGAAHGKGIVHRDLKPENVFLLDDGQVKILDFGLARQATADAHSGATQTMASTDPGVVMGTVGYMAPEQVRGQIVDARADVFAFGAVLYEMVSGQRAFQRATAADTMSAILTQDPPELAGSRPDLSPALDRIMRHCLEKNANERFQSARDVAFALEALSGTGVATGVSSGAIPAPPPTKRNRWLLPVAGLALAAVAVAGGFALGQANSGGRGDVRFEARTWDRQWVTNARFGPDGKSIVFSAALAGNVPSLYVIRDGTFMSQQVGQPGVHLLSVSSTGELAVILDPEPQGHRIFHGTLARMTLDGAPRELMKDVTEADWSPDGSKLAIIRRDGGKYRLEYPSGTLLYETQTGYLSDPRVSPDGTQVAFFDHPIRHDNRGWVKVAGPGGARTLAGEYWALEGIAWDGESVLFTGTAEGHDSLQPIAVSVSGEPRPRKVLSGAGAMLVFDLGAGGRMLITRDDFRASVRGLVPGESVERDFPWLDTAVWGFFTRDGKKLLFNDESQSAGGDYAVTMRDVASGQVVRLGPGLTLPPSPDGKWVPGLRSSTGRIVLYPIGAGEPVELNKGPIAQYTSSFNWFPDSRRVTVCGTEAGRPPRCYEQEIPGGAPKPITSDGVSRVLLAHDGRTLLARRAGGSETMTIDGARPVAAKGVEDGDEVIGWTTDDRGVIVTKVNTIPGRIERVDLATGQRTMLRELAPPDRSGLVIIWAHQWLDDGRGYTYTYMRQLSQIYVVTGAR